MLGVRREIEVQPHFLPLCFSGFLRGRAVIYLVDLINYAS